MFLFGSSYFSYFLPARTAEIRDDFRQARGATRPIFR